MVMVGDADSDEVISIIDAITIQKMIISNDTPTDVEEAVMDVNYDEEISVTDVIYVMKHITGDSNCAHVGEQKRVDTSMPAV